MSISILSPLPRDTLTTLDIDVPMNMNKSETVKHEAPWYNVHSALQLSLPSMSNLSVLAVQWSVESMKTGMMHVSFQLHKALLYSVSVHSARLACTQSSFMHFAQNSQAEGISPRTKTLYNCPPHKHHPHIDGNCTWCPHHNRYVSTWKLGTIRKYTRAVASSMGAVRTQTFGEGNNHPFLRLR